ncbi:DinB family protein [Evansella cellulosilytica]|uniref:DinB family protein n=1 Tax=Evansella cellulosilytica (strain ATCC 21833 / DSM 2522 / FERM P-1141 / JCM 9156 / N-4) TaxID=649639 RepID=E6TSM0_EVAC2|nr:DinB family protein [Evansella cellulosilytica]ADU29528.1 DinB family protein [Evansella cellulosilytica DSM 2522]
MIHFFEYNWQVRDEWFDWCKQLSNEELLKDRTGGVGSILYTLFHIIDVEYSWVRGIQGKEDIVFEFADYDTLERVMSLSDRFRNELTDFLINNLEEMKGEVVSVAWDEEQYTADEILHHIIAHEIHHVGQLSVWARELQKSPVPSHFVGRKLKSIFS